MTESRGQALYRSSIVLDAHVDLPSKILDEGYDPDRRHTPLDGHTDLPRLVESGITALFLIAWVDAAFAATAGALRGRALDEIRVVHDFVARHPNELTLATSAADVRRAKTDGRIAVLIGVEGGHAIEDSLDTLRALYEQGVRYLTLTWNNGNGWAGSSIGADGTRTGGLTPFGRRVIREMNRLGMLVDLSHASDATVADVLATSAAPVIASHSCARALADHPRNLWDAQLRAIAAAGGVVGVNFYARFLDARTHAAFDTVDQQCAALDMRLATHADLDAHALAKRLHEERRAMTRTIPRPPFDTLIRHIEHIASVAGAEHVALGSDFDGMGVVPEGMDDVTHLPAVAEALVARGFSDAEVRGVMGENMLRVMDEAARCAMVHTGRPET